MTTFTEDQIKKIRETLGDEAVAKLTLPKVRVPKYVTGEWLVDNAVRGVKAEDFEGDVTTYLGSSWEGRGDTPSYDESSLYTVTYWPNGEIFENLPKVEPIKGNSGLKAGDRITSVEQLEELPVGSTIAFDEWHALNKSGERWIKDYGLGEHSSEDVFQNYSGTDLYVLRVGCEL